MPNYTHFPKGNQVTYPSIYNWLYLPNLWKNIQFLFLRLKMQERGWKNDLYKNKFESFVMFDNQLLMYRIFRNIEQIYTSNRFVKPFSIFYTQNPNNLIEQERSYVDQIWGTRNQAQITTDNLKFPMQHIGYQGLYNVARFLFSTNPDFADMVTENHVYVPSQAYKTVTDELVYRLRQKTRSSLNIGI